jgi:hypothetical protein
MSSFGFLKPRFDELSQWGGVTFFIDESGNKLESTGLELYEWQGSFLPTAKSPQLVLSPPKLPMQAS